VSQAVRTVDPGRTSEPLADRTGGRLPAIGRAAARIIAPGTAMIYLSLLVLIPIAALSAKAFDGGWSGFWGSVRNPESWAALKLTLISALIVVVVNTIAGTAIAWVLVRDQFFGKRLIASLVDLPFALPTIVAGLTLLSLYGPDSPFHLNASGTRIGVWIALAFVTLPFSVRAVQPVLAALDRDAEEAAASLGANSHTVLRRIVLPSLAPAMLSGAMLAFARAMGEYGSLVFISGDKPFSTEVGSVRIFGLYENGQDGSAAAVSLALLLLSLVVLLVFGAFRRRLSRPEVLS
jgi:sulfate/thiosulfate transport system permease protein